MQHPKTIAKDDLWFTGIVLLGLSLIFTVMAWVHPPKGDGNLCYFLLSMLFTGLYTFLLVTSGRLRKGRDGLHPIFVFLLLSLVSAYALNRVMNIFDDSADWFSVVLILIGTNYVLLRYFNRMPSRVRCVLSFVLGCSLVVFAYLALYLLPLYIFSIVGLIAFGISLHTFVPLLFCIYTIVLIRRIGSRLYTRIFCWGVGVTLAGVTVFIIIWVQQVNAMNAQYTLYAGKEKAGYPAWVSVARQTGTGLLTEKILKGDIVYNGGELYRNGFFWSTPSRNFDEAKKHDPLVVIGTLFSDDLLVSVADRVKMLEVLYDARHKTEQRLWRGDDLQTTQVHTTVQIWPQLYLSYTQLNMTVANTALHNNWNGREEEAIYTFHLPEGGVVTSLSLWINGKEEKGILTTKAKADSAYKAIVGVQRRDPSVVHWQEGNRVTVRVFPVMRGETRRFQVGVTAPLQSTAKQLIYQPFYFDGPAAGNATGKVDVLFEQAPGHCETPGSFIQEDEQHYSSTGDYHTSWQLAFDRHKPQHDAFSFDGREYRLYELDRQRTSFDLKNVYLDVNREWTEEEWNTVYELVKHKNVYVAGDNNDLVKLSTLNHEAVFELLRRQQFSLFPFHLIPDAASALVISKSGTISPVLKDLQQTAFNSQLTACFSTAQKLRLFNLGMELSPYLQSLKQARAFYYEQGNTELLQQLLAGGRFAVDMENAQQVVLDNAGLVISREDSSSISSPVAAPDHLMRLFAYNHILQQAGTGLLTGEEMPAALVEEADKAYVVSPVSSLIVLETQKDYDDFDIKRSKNSLQNAAIQSKGAVPEPHEWALIILVMVVLLFAWGKPRMALIRQK